MREIICTFHNFNFHIGYMSTTGTYLLVYLLDTATQVLHNAHETVKCSNYLFAASYIVEFILRDGFV